MIQRAFYIIPDNCQTLGSTFSVIKTRFSERSLRQRTTPVSPSDQNIIFKNLYKLAASLHVNIQYMKIKLKSSTNVPEKIG